MGDGGTNCDSSEGTVRSLAACQTAASKLGLQFSKQVSPTTSRPAGCFWNVGTPRTVYYNPEFTNPTSPWGGTGPICVTKVDQTSTAEEAAARAALVEAALTALADHISGTFALSAVSAPPLSHSFPFLALSAFIPQSLSCTLVVGLCQPVTPVTTNTTRTWIHQEHVPCAAD
jgi:hypothetical protein